MCLARNCGYAQGRLNFNAVGDSGFLNLLTGIIEKPEGSKILLWDGRCGLISGLSNYYMIPSRFLVVRPLTSVSDSVHFVQKSGSFRLIEQEIFPLSQIFAKGRQTVARDPQITV